MTSPNLTGDDCPDMMTGDEERFAELAAHRVNEIRARCGGDLLKCAAWLFQNERDGCDIDSAVGLAFSLELKAAGLMPVWKAWMIGPTTPSDPMYAVVAARHERRRVRAEGFHLLAIDMDTTWLRTNMDDADDNDNERDDAQGIAA